MKVRSFACILAALVSPAMGETVLLKNGSFFEGKITVQTSRSIRMDTQFGSRTFLRSEIDEIIPSGSAEPLPGDFSDLKPAERAVMNAMAEYRLADYESAQKRIESLTEFDGNEELRIQRDWLVIEIQERLGQWDTARRLLNEKLETGTPRERIRANAHLDVLKSNPDYDLRFVGEKHARNFITSEELRNKARERDSLRDHRIMQLALEEYCEQLLVEDKLSVKVFAEKLDPEATYKAVIDSAGRNELAEILPYMPDLKNAEASLVKAQSILGDFGKAFELDLARTEMYHLLLVGDRLIGEAFQVSPEDFNPPADPRSGQLTPQGRQQWQERCDEFLRRAKPALDVLDYMKQRVDRFPNGLRDLYDFLSEINPRLDEMVKSVRKARGRTHV